jgi:hypothetical protein
VGGALSLILVLKLIGTPRSELVAPGQTLAIGRPVAGFMIFQTWALVEGGPGKTAVLIFTMPIWTCCWPGRCSASGCAASSGWRRPAR